MKNSEIHTGLPNKELRDFLSIALVKIFDQESDLKKGPAATYNPNSPFDYQIKDAQNEIIFWGQKLQYIKEKAAILQIIKMNGWEEFDVSDETRKDLPYKLFISFIGTKQEYDTLVKKMKNTKPPQP